MRKMYWFCLKTWLISLAVYTLILAIFTLFGEFDGLVAVLLFAVTSWAYVIKEYLKACFCAGSEVNISDIDNGFNIA